MSNMYSARVPSARLLSLAHYLQEAHDQQRRDCQRLETQYHALRRSTRDLERYWGLYCAELEDELGIPHWQTNPPELAPGRTDRGTLEALPTQRARQDEYRGRTGGRTVERFSRYHGPLPSGNTQHRGSTSPDKTSSNKRIVEPRSPLMNPNPSPFVRTSYPREPFRAMGPQPQQQLQPGYPENHTHRSRSAPDPKGMISREQLYAMHTEPTNNAPQPPRHNPRPDTPEPRNVVPPPPHPRRGIRYQPPEPANPHSPSQLCRLNIPGDRRTIRAVPII